MESVMERIRYAEVQVKTIKINSVAEYVDAVSKGNIDIKKDEPGAILLFRGQPDKESELIPSIGRIGANGKALISEERNMVKMARYKLPTVFRRELEPIELLALLQHHGIPTRLLDVTSNALVGLYFSCHGPEKTEDVDGEVLIFKTDDIDISNYSMVNIICESYKRVNEQSQEELARLYDFCQKPIFVYAPSYSLRQNIQSGRYILFANKIEKNEDGYKLTSSMQPIDKDDDAISYRIIIPAKLKKEIRRDLRLLGISKELLFLDNTDTVCREIRDRFSER